MLELTDTNFDGEIVKRRGVLCLVDFWAPWCGPCKMLAPILQKIADKHGDKLIVGKYNVESDGNRNKAGAYGVLSLPTLLLFKDGKVVWNQTGLVPQAKIEDKLNEYSF